MKKVKFSYHSGVSYHARSRLFVAIPLLLLVGVGGGVSVSYTSQARQFASSLLSRSSQSSPTSPAAASPAGAVLAKGSTLPAQDGNLAKKLTAKLATFPKEQEWSIYVEDITSGRVAAINPDASYQPLALSNLFLLPPLESKIPSDNWTLRLQDKTLKQCVDLMLRAADPGCAPAVTRLVNAQYADSFNENLGFPKTKITATSQQTTAREVGRLLTLLRRGQVLSDKARRHIFDSLYDQKHTPGIALGCGACRVADLRTIENQDGFTHNAGVVTHGPNSYVLVIMSKGGTFTQVAGLTRMIEAELNP